jgi:hypothetical protein
MPRGRPPICPSCGSNRSQKKGVRITKTMGARRIRLCKNCGKKFSPKNHKPVQVEDIQTGATSVTESKVPAAVELNEPELTETQIPEP